MSKSSYDLNKLAAELAVVDCGKGRNVDRVDVQTVIGALGAFLRAAAPEKRCAVLQAIISRAGLRMKVKGGGKC
jgi:hypothetical protein